MAELYRTRPSSFLGWDDPDDWVARMVFDINVMDFVKDTKGE